MAYNSIIRVKEKICISCGKPCVWFSKKRCQQCAKVEDFYVREEREIAKDEGLSELITRLDGLVSKYVRYSAPKNKNNEIQCYTCEKWISVPESDAGHYVRRAIMFLRFDVTRNIRPQCHGCNRHNYGMAHVFGKKLEQEMPGVTEIMFQESLIVYKWSRDELLSMIADYTQKLKSLK